MVFSLEQQEYEALIALARKGVTTPDEILQLEAFLRNVETKNGIIRYLVWVQWQEQDQPLPPTTRFPESWPPTQRKLLEYISRPVARADADAVVAKYARRPINILCTKDPAAIVGWTAINQFFIT